MDTLETKRIRSLIAALQHTLGNQVVGETKVIEDTTVPDIEVMLGIDEGKQHTKETVRFVQINDFVADGQRHYQLHARFSTLGSVQIVHRETDYEPDDLTKRIDQSIEFVHIDATEMTALALAWLEWAYDDGPGVSFFGINENDTGIS